MENIIFPRDVGVIDVTPFGAVPSDGQDDTAAIQGALNDLPTGNHILYFPNGTYDISNTLMLSGSQKRNIFQGQNEHKTVLQLQDSLSPIFTGAIINFGPDPAQHFRNSIRNITLNTGSNHPKAVSVRFNASNQGIMSNVTIQSGDGQGDIGLDMNYTDEVGPLLIKNVTVNGFDYGIVTRWPTASKTFANITLSNQNIYGWHNTSSQKVFAQNVVSTNAVTAISNDGEAGFILVDSTLTGTGTVSTEPAIINQKSIFIRNVLMSGYELAVDSVVCCDRGNSDISVGYVEEYLGNGAGENLSGGAFELFPSPDRMLGLPIEKSPQVHWEQNLSNWDGPHHHCIGNSGIPDDEIDDAPSIQAEIDSGATTIYLPRGTWTINSPVKLRRNVSRFLGTEAVLTAGSNGVIRILDGNGAALVIERLESKDHFLTIEHASDRTVILNSLLEVRYKPSIATPGNVFMNDVVLLPSTFTHQNVWARKLNMEGDTQSDMSIEAKLLNNNARVWLLGVKTEDEGTLIKTINGGLTELYGILHVGSGVSNERNPQFVTVESSFSAAGVYGDGFSILARETRENKIRTTSTFNFADAYVAYKTLP